MGKTCPENGISNLDFTLDLETDALDKNDARYKKLETRRAELLESPPRAVQEPVIHNAELTTEGEQLLKVRFGEGVKN